jgi:hypothetical protein
VYERRGGKEIIEEGIREWNERSGVYERSV